MSKWIGSMQLLPGDRPQISKSDTQQSFFQTVFLCTSTWHFNLCRIHQNRLECPIDNPPPSDNPPRPVFSITWHAYVCTCTCTSLLSSAHLPTNAASCCLTVCKHVTWSFTENGTTTLKMTQQTDEISSVHVQHGEKKNYWKLVADCRAACVAEHVTIALIQTGLANCVHSRSSL